MITNQNNLSKEELINLLENNQLALPKAIKTNALCPTNDVIFHCLFGTKGNEKITKSFIEEILERKIDKIDLDKNLNLIRKHYDNKLGILDVRAQDKQGVNYNIEMQNTTSDFLAERILSYWSRLYVSDLMVGDNYGTLNKTIAILILNDNMKSLNEIIKYHTKWQLREEQYRDIVLTDHLEIHIIELEKYKKYRATDNKRGWLDFIMNPEGKEVDEIMAKNKTIAEAKSKWKAITEDQKIRDRALRLEIARLDYNTGIANAKASGFTEGHASGLAEGRASGLADGLAEGRKSEKIETAKKMLAENFDIDLIVRITGLTKEEIESL